MKRTLLCACVLIILCLSAMANAAGASVTINEVMASASKFRSGNGEDWVELRNNTSARVNVSGYTLALGKGGKRFTLPAGTVMAPGSCLLIPFTDKTAGSAMVSGFPLPRLNGALTLYDSAGNATDAVALGTQYGNVSYGRLGENGDFFYLADATPGRENTGAGYAARADTPVLTPAGGLYTGAVKVTLTAQPSAQIRYTLDGSVPNAHSALYTAPLAFDSTAVLRAVALSDTLLASAPAAATYFIGLDIAAPVISLMTDNVYLYDSTYGVLVRGGDKIPNYERDWEYPMQLEYYGMDGQSEINQECGFCISGEVSRRYSQKAMAFYARAAYGNDSFAFNPFPNRDFTAYKSFTLRSAGTEGLRNGIRFRDAMLTGLALETNTLVSDAVPVLVYLNGKLWGHCNLRERINKYCVAQHEGITDPDTIDAIDILTASGAVNNGSAKDYLTLRNFMKNNDLNDPASLRYVLDRMDIDSYFDYAAFMMMTGSYDVSNARYYRVPGGKWKWALFDLDTAMLKADSNNPMVLFLRPKGSPIQYDFDHVPFSALMEVPGMKDKFLARLGELMARRFTASTLDARLNEWKQVMLPIIPYHIQKWTFLTLTSWSRNIEEFRVVLKARPDYVVASARTLFKLTDAQVRQYFGDFLAANAAAADD
jgi:hypothetical protein